MLGIPSFSSSAALPQVVNVLSECEKYRRVGTEHRLEAASIGRRVRRTRFRVNRLSQVPATYLMTLVLPGVHGRKKAAGTAQELRILAILSAAWPSQRGGMEPVFALPEMIS